MVLANFNVTNCLIEQIKNYLNTNTWDFLGLKNLILQAKSIPEITIPIDSSLAKAEANELEKIRQQLAEQYYKKQVSEDEAERKADQIKKAKDDQLKARFNQELKKLSSTIEQMMSEQQQQLQKMNPASLSQLTSSQYPTALQNNRLQQAIQQYDIKLHFLYEKKKLLRDKIYTLENKEQLYAQKEQARNSRKQAGLVYQGTQQHIEASLSESNKLQLNKDYNTLCQSVKKKKSQLNSSVSHLQTELFLQQLSDYIPQTQLSLQEKTALEAMLKLCQKHHQHQNDLSLFQNSLSKKKSLISHLIVQLHGEKDKLRLLNKQNHLSANEELNGKIKTLAQSLEYNSSTKKRLNTFSLLFLGLSFFSSIPLILALNGTLSFLTSILMYCLVAIPPALCLVSTLSLAIASLVYYFKIKENTESIKNNKQLIATNYQQEQKKELALKELELITIPNLEQQIKQEENLREELAKTIDKTEKQLNDSLAQAQQITPVSLDKVSIFKAKFSESSEKQLDLSSSVNP